LISRSKSARIARHATSAMPVHLSSGISNMSETPTRLPNAATVEAVLAGLDPASADSDLAPALSAAFPGFAFSTAVVDDFYWRDSRTVLAADGARLGYYREWVARELADSDGDLAAFWNRHRNSKALFCRMARHRGVRLRPDRTKRCHFVQLSLGREIEVLAGPVVDPGYRPWSADDLLEPSWVKREPLADAPVLAGPVFRLQRRSGLVHMRSFLATRERLEREERETRRPEREARAVYEVGRDCVKDTLPGPQSGLVRFRAARGRMFRDWERSSASTQRIFEYWAFDIRDYQDQSRRKLSFIPRPLKLPAERLLVEEGASIHRLMEGVESIDAEVGLPFAWFFLMTHGHRVDPGCRNGDR
jgi:hypothetical protein